MEVHSFSFRPHQDPFIFCGGQRVHRFWSSFGLIDTKLFGEINAMNSCNINVASQPRCLSQQNSGPKFSSCAIQDFNNLCASNPSNMSSDYTQTIQRTQRNSGTIPNTFVISSAGQDVKVAMGGCNVKPVGSPITNFAGYYETCSGKADVSYARTNYGPNYSSC